MGNWTEWREITADGIIPADLLAEEKRQFWTSRGSLLAHACEAVCLISCQDDSVSDGDGDGCALIGLYVHSWDPAGFIYAERFADEASARLAYDDLAIDYADDCEEDE